MGFGRLGGMVLTVCSRKIFLRRGLLRLRSEEWEGFKYPKSKKQGQTRASDRQRPCRENTWACLSSLTDVRGPDASYAMGEAGNEANQNGKARAVSLDCI